MRPSSRTALTIDGNTAHSTGWWWNRAGAFYIGGSLYYDSDGKTLVYNAGRDQKNGNRSPCTKNHCAAGDCDKYCQPADQYWNRITNSKAFLVPGPGFNSWSGRMEVVGYESHDNGLSLEALESGFWIDNMLAQCRTGVDIVLPPEASPTYIRGDGFFWYDTGMDHVITNSIFRHCGYRSDEYDQYGTSPDRGCGADSGSGCSSDSTTFGFLTHSDQHNPELMQGTKNIVFESCGRRFKLYDYRGASAPSSTVSGRLQNWLDIDGTISGFNESTLIGSGLADAGQWWTVDNDVVHDPQGPLKFIKQYNGPERGLGHIKLKWDDSVHNEVGKTVCGNGGGQPCSALGYIKHAGERFESDNGLPVTANADIVGPVGGYGWVLQMNQGSPKALKLESIEVRWDTPMLLHLPYPVGTGFTIVAHATWCTYDPYHCCIEDEYHSCQEAFQEVGSIADVRSSLGNTYYVNPTTGMLTIRVVQTPQTFVGDPDWSLYDNASIGEYGIGSYALERFEREGVYLPMNNYGPYLQIHADCKAGSGNNQAFCATQPQTVTVDVCPVGYSQVAYDKCCSISNPSLCEYADGTDTGT